MWCWVRTEWRNLRLATFYGPTWAAIISTFVIYIVTGRKILKSRRQLNRFTESSGRTKVMHRKAHLNLEDSIQLSTKSDSEVGLTSSPKLEETEDDRACTLTSSRQLAPNQNRSALRESHSAAFAYARVAILFFIAMVVTWVSLNAGTCPILLIFGLPSFLLKPTKRLTNLPRFLPL